MRPFVEFKEESGEAPSRGAAESTPNENRKSGTNDSPQTGAKVTGNIPGIDPSRDPASSSSSQYEKHFDDLIEEANAGNSIFQGTDFKEFIDSKIDVDAIADEGTRYRTAFNVLKRTGLTKDRLISTGREYINIIERDLSGFADAFNNQYDAEVKQKEGLLKKKTDELQALTEKITSLNKEIKEMSEDVRQSREHLTANKELFNSAGRNKIKEIQEELKKINEYF